MSPNSEEMAEKLSTGDKFDANPPDEKVKVLNKIAEVSYQQGNYHLATKKWTQSGNRLQAMKSLLKSGDTEKIIFFANVSRQRDIYILAGEYIFLVKPQCQVLQGHRTQIDAFQSNNFFWMIECRGVFSTGAMGPAVFEHFITVSQGQHPQWKHSINTQHPQY